MPETASLPSSALPLEPLLFAIGDLTRWKILAALSEGESLMVLEIAERVGRSPSLISKHLAPLRRLGLVTRNRAGLYRIPAAYLPEPRVAEFGPCRLRF